MLRLLRQPLKQCFRPCSLQELILKFDSEEFGNPDDEKLIFLWSVDGHDHPDIPIPIMDCHHQETIHVMTNFKHLHPSDASTIVCSFDNSKGSFTLLK